MATPCNTILAESPFQTYRDPITGEWQITYHSSPSTLIATPSKIVDLAMKRQQRSNVSTPSLAVEG